MAINSSQKFVRAFKLAFIGCTLPLLLSGNSSWAQTPTDAEISEYIEKFRTSDDWRVYQDSLRDLQRMGPLAVPALRQALKDPDVRVRVYSADALINIGYEAKEAVYDLAEALKDPDKYVRASAGEALEAIGDQATEAIPALKRALNDSDAYVRYIAAKALATMGSKVKDAVPDLRKTLKDGNGYVRAAAAETLGAVGPKAKEAVEDLIEALKDKNPYVRSAAAAALGAIKTDAKPAVPSLIRLLKNREDNKYVRSAAAAALGEIGANPKTTIPALVEALNDSKDRVRASAASALGDIGCRARDTIPNLIDSLNEEEEERSNAISGIGNIAGACQEKAENLSDAEISLLIADLEKTLEVLKTQPDSQLKEEEIASLSRPLKALQAQKDSRFSSVLGQWMAKNVFLSGFLIYIVAFPTLWGLILLIKPIWLLRINSALEPYSEFQLTGFMKGTKLSLRAILLLTFFAYQKRVLDSWVSNYVKEARSQFKQKDSVVEHANYLPIPATIDGKSVSPLTVSDLHAKFRQKQCYILIWGEAGSGKSSVAFQIAKWAMSENLEERLCDHLMLPILIEEELDNAVVAKSDTKKADKKSEKPKSAFMEIVRGQLQDLINEVKPISEELVERLLEQQRLVVIVDRFSEMSDTSRAEIRPESADFPVNALVVTSRFEEKLGRVVKTSIKPLRIEGNLLSSFLEDYLSEIGARSLFSDMEFLDACRELSLRIGERSVPVMLVKMYGDLTISRQQGKIRGELAENIPAMMLGYLYKINEEVLSGRLDNRVVQQDAKALSWECLKNTYRMAVTKRKDAIAALGEKSEDRLKYLEERLRLVETIGIYQDQIRFTLEPLAEYLASLHLVDIYGDKEESWREFLNKATKVPGGAQAIKSFLLALRDCCLSKVTDTSVPEFAIHQLEILTGLRAPEPEPVEESPSVAPAPESALETPGVTTVTVSVPTQGTSEEGEQTQNVTTVTVSLPTQQTPNSTTAEESSEQTPNVTTVTVAVSSPTAQAVAAGESAEPTPTVTTVTVAVPAQPTGATEPEVPAIDVAARAESAETVQPVTTAAESAETLQPVATLAESAETLQPVATVAESAETVQPVPTVAESTVQPVPTVAESAETVQPVPTVAQEAETVQPVPTVAQEAETVQPVATVAEEAETVQPVTTVPESAVQPVTTVAQEAETVQPVATVTESTVQPVPMVAEEAETVQPVPTVGEAREQASTIAVTEPAKVAPTVAATEQKLDGAIASLPTDGATVAEPVPNGAIASSPTINAVTPPFFVSNQTSAEGDLPNSIPELMLLYLHHINHNVQGEKISDSDLERDAKALAWECLKSTYRPATANRQAAIAALGGERAEFRLQYLEDELHLIQTLPGDEIRFSLDPLAEYLAGLHLVELYGVDNSKWQTFLNQADSQKASESIKSFLLAARNCYLAKIPGAKNTDFVPTELGYRAGLNVAAPLSQPVQPASP